MAHTADDIQAHVRLYYKVFGTLLVLTLLTVAVSYLHLPHTPAVIVALAIAALKASLVATFFMHLVLDWKKLYFMIIPALVLGVLMILVLLPDIVLIWRDLHHEM